MAYRDNQAAKVRNPITFDHLAAQAALYSKPFTKEELEKSARIELWCSSFSDPGEDWNEWRLFNDSNELVAKRRANGY